MDDRFVGAAGAGAREGMASLRSPTLSASAAADVEVETAAAFVFLTAFFLRGGIVGGSTTSVDRVEASSIPPVAKLELAPKAVDPMG